MIKISKPKLYKAFGLKFKDKVACGVDTASKTGWCIATSRQGSISLDYGVLNMSKITDHKIKYQMIYNFFNELFCNTHCDNVVIEDTFMGRNVKALSFMSRIGGIVYAVALHNNQPTNEFLLAIQARKMLGLRSNVKKELVHIEFKEKTGLKIEDPDAIDAIILALCGLAKEK